MKTRENELHEPIIKIEHVKKYSMDWIDITCSVCGNMIEQYYCAGSLAKIEYSNYCKNCGARLKEIEK